MITPHQKKIAGEISSFALKTIIGILFISPLIVGVCFSLQTDQELMTYQSEVNNGGHDQFYSNSTGIVWEDAMNGAREMGMEELYGIIRESADRMGGKPAKEREDRWDQMSDLEPEFGDLNKRLYAMEKADDIEQRMAAYALENRQALYFDGEVEMPVFED